MTARIRNLLVVCAAMISFGAGAKEDDKKDIERLYSELSKHIKANDPDGILPLETSDVKSKGRDSKLVGGKELAVQMKQESMGNKMKKFDIKIAKVTIKGKTASAETAFDAVSEMTGPDKKKHVMSMNGAVHNDLVKTLDGWIFKYMDEKGGAMKMDGKPFDPSKMGGSPSPAPKKK